MGPPSWCVKSAAGFPIQSDSASRTERLSFYSWLAPCQLQRENKFLSAQILAQKCLRVFCWSPLLSVSFKKEGSKVISKTCAKTKCHHIPKKVNEGFLFFRTESGSIASNPFRNRGGGVY